MQLAANLSWMYGALDWPDRFEAAARDGFEGVEILLPYDESASWYSEMLQANGLTHGYWLWPLYAVLLLLALVLSAGFFIIVERPCMDPAWVTHGVAHMKRTVSSAGSTRARAHPEA